MFALQNLPLYLSLSRRPRPAELKSVLEEVAPSPDEVEEHGAMLEYVANLCATLHVDNDFSFGAWGVCVTPYLASFLPAFFLRHRQRWRRQQPKPRRRHLSLPRGGRKTSGSCGKN